METLI